MISDRIGVIRTSDSHDIKRLCPALQGYCTWKCDLVRLDDPIIIANMQSKTCLLWLATAQIAVTAPGLTSRHESCSGINIPVTVSEKRYVLDTTVENDWDVVSLTFNLTAQNFGQPDNPVPITGQTESAVTSNYSIGATICGTGSTLLVLTHGILESKL